MQHIKQALIAKGGDSLTNEDLNRIERKIKEQYGFLAGFAADIKAGKITPAMLESRSKMYVSASKGSYEQAKLAAQGSNLGQSSKEVAKKIKGNENRNKILVVIAGVVLITAAGIIITSTAPVSVTAGGLAATSTGAIVVSGGSLTSTGGALATVTTTGALVQSGGIAVTGTQVTSAALVVSKGGALVLASKGGLVALGVAGGALMLTQAGNLAKYLGQWVGGGLLAKRAIHLKI